MIRLMSLALLVCCFNITLLAQSIPTLVVTPFGYVGGLYAYCVDNNGNFVPNCTPTITNGYYTYSGGHNHDTGPKPHLYGVVNNNGQGNGDTPTYQISFSASRVGQTEFIEACANTCAVTTVYVQFDSFDQLQSDDWQILVGQNGIHPVNHGGLSNIVTAISDITYRYAVNYQNVSGYQTVGVNDMALTGGGVFDLNIDWDSPHIRHDYGKAVDFRANFNSNSVLPQAYNDFVQYCKDGGFNSRAFVENKAGTTDPNDDPNQHIHCDAN